MTTSLAVLARRAPEAVFGRLGGDRSPAEAVRERELWVRHAKCRDIDPDRFFVRGAKQRKAAEICDGCPVVQLCLADALDNNVEFGVWGGRTERQRRALLRHNPQIEDWAEFLASGGDVDELQSLSRPRPAARRG